MKTHEQIDQEAAEGLMKLNAQNERQRVNLDFAQRLMRMNYFLDTMKQEWVQGEGSVGHAG